jgi:hypothetical protein
MIRRIAIPGFLVIALLVVFTSGCALWPEEDKEPRTVTEWMKQKRVGEDLR